RINKLIDLKIVVINFPCSLCAPRFLCMQIEMENSFPRFINVKSINDLSVGNDALICLRYYLFDFKTIEVFNWNSYLHIGLIRKTKANIHLFLISQITFILHYDIPVYYFSGT